MLSIYASLLLIAFVFTILVMYYNGKGFWVERMKFFKKLILTDSTKTEIGYVSNVNRTELVGMKVYALTHLDLRERL